MATGTRTAKPKPPPSTLVLLVRHGATATTGKVLPGRAPGLHLSEVGRQQASQLGERLAKWAPDDSSGPRISAVYASPLERTQETAGLIASAVGLRVRVARGLTECDFGDWTGSSLKQLMRLPEWATVQRYPTGFRFPGGESFAGMQARMVQVVSDLCARHRGETVVAVSHADPIKAVVAEALGAHLDLFQRIVISPCSVSAINYGHLGPLVLAVNSTGSLAELFR